MSTSVSWAPSKSSMERRWPCLHSDALCPGVSVFENHCGRAEESGEGSPVGKQNKDLLLWKDQGRLGGLLARLDDSCWGPGCDPSRRGCCLLPSAQLVVVVLGEGMEGGLCSDGRWLLPALGSLLCTLCACGEEGTSR